MAKLKYTLQLLILCILTFLNGILCIYFEKSFVKNISIQVKKIPKKLDKQKAVEHIKNMYKDV